MVNPIFTPDKPGTYTATLIVNNGSLDSAPSTVEISANVAPPIADAGAAQTVHPVATVTLDGSQSFDPNGLPLTYNWTLQAPAGSNATLSDPHAIKPSFTADVLGNYTATW